MRMICLQVPLPQAQPTWSTSGWEVQKVAHQVTPAQACVPYETCRSVVVGAVFYKWTVGRSTTAFCRQRPWLLMGTSAGRKSAYIHRIYALATMNEDEDSPLPLNR